MNKKLKKNIKELFDLLVDEAEKNEEFASALSHIFSGDAMEQKSNPKEKRKSNRRDKAILDPIKLAEEGQLSTEQLSTLSEKELKDIIADYGMDPSKLAMKWKNKNRLIQLIIDTSFRRASKGDAFRK